MLPHAVTFNLHKTHTVHFDIFTGHNDYKIAFITLCETNFGFAG